MPEKLEDRFSGIFLMPAAGGAKTPNPIKQIHTIAHVGVETLKAFVEEKIRVGPNRKKANFEMIDHLSIRFAELIRSGGIVSRARMTHFGLHDIELPDFIREKLESNGIFSAQNRDAGYLDLGYNLASTSQVNIMARGFKAGIISTPGKVMKLTHPGTGELINGWPSLARELEQVVKQEALERALNPIFMKGTVVINVFGDELQKSMQQEQEADEDQQIAG